MKLRTSSVVVGLLFTSGLMTTAQQPVAQIRSSQVATPRPAPPASATADLQFRSAMTFGTRPFNSTAPFPRRDSWRPVFPLVWDAETMPAYHQRVGTPLKEGPMGGVQLDLLPWRASVFVDGVRVGQVGDFNGYYKHLKIVAGPHEIMVLEPGYNPLILYVVVVPGRTLTYRYTLDELSQ